MVFDMFFFFVKLLSRKFYLCLTLCKMGTSAQCASPQYCRCDEIKGKYKKENTMTETWNFIFWYFDFPNWIFPNRIFQTVILLNCISSKLHFSILFQKESLGTQIKDLALLIITVPSFSKSVKNWPRYGILNILF